jgi:hypothetical protein
MIYHLAPLIRGCFLSACCLAEYSDIFTRTIKLNLKRRVYMGIVTNATNAYQKCIGACTRCAQACYECLEACLNEQDVQARTKCIKMLVECARICEMSVAGMSSNARFAKQHCALCATVCEACARECRMFKDRHCQECAAECDTCVKECRNMAEG